MSTTMETPVKKQRGRPPAKATTSNTMDSEQQQPTSANKMVERRGRGIPLGSRASTTKVEGTPKSTKPTPAPTPDVRAQERAMEKQEYKAAMQKYLKDRLKQGKSKVKLDNSIRLLEAKMKAL